MQFNISVDTRDAGAAGAVLRAVRERSGGLAGVTALALPHSGTTEIACNVDSFPLDPGNRLQAAQLAADMLEPVLGGHYRTRFSVIEEVVAAAAARAGTRLTGNSVIIGFTPQQAAALTLEAVASGTASLVTELSTTQM